MSNRRRSQGFSLIELLLVLAIIGIISTIAIPSFLGQRRRARLIGDARANAQVIRMQLEQRRADNGTYGTAGTTYTWSNGSPSVTSFLPGFTPKNDSKMNFAIAIGSTGLTYTLHVYDPSLGGAEAFNTNQAGSSHVLVQ